MLFLEKILENCKARLIPTSRGFNEKKQNNNSNNIIHFIFLIIS